MNFITTNKTHETISVYQKSNDNTTKEKERHILSEYVKKLNHQIKIIR